MSYDEVQFHFSLITMLWNIDYDVRARAREREGRSQKHLFPFFRKFGASTLGELSPTEAAAGFITEYREKSAG